MCVFEMLLRAGRDWFNLLLRAGRIDWWDGMYSNVVVVVACGTGCIRMLLV